MSKKLDISLFQQKRKTGDMVRNKVRTLVEIIAKLDNENESDKPLIDVHIHLVESDTNYLAWMFGYDQPVKETELTHSEHDMLSELEAHLCE